MTGPKVWCKTRWSTNKRNHDRACSWYYLTFAGTRKYFMHMRLQTILWKRATKRPSVSELTYAERTINQSAADVFVVSVHYSQIPISIQACWRTRNHFQDISWVECWLWFPGLLSSYSLSGKKVFLETVDSLGIRKAQRLTGQRISCKMALDKCKVNWRDFHASRITVVGL